MRVRDDVDDDEVKQKDGGGIHRSTGTTRNSVATSHATE